MIEHISAVIITKNAVDTIRTTLESLKDFQEIVVFDSGSIDGTVDLIKNYDNVSLYSGDFLGFGETKNHAISLASNDWFLSLDADEIVSNELILHLNEVGLQSNLVGEVQRKNFFMGKEMTTCGWGRDIIIRFLTEKIFVFQTKKCMRRLRLANLQKRFC